MQPLMRPFRLISMLVITAALALSVGLAGGGIYALVTGERGVQMTEWPAGEHFFNSVPGLLLAMFAGIVLLFVTLNVAKALGWVHGRIAEALLAKI